MPLVWLRALPQPFVVWDVKDRMPELAYTTIMTTVAKLADKGLLIPERTSAQRAILYRAAGTPSQFLGQESRDRAAHLVKIFGNAALAAFAQELDRLSPGECERLTELAGR